MWLKWKDFSWSQGKVGHNLKVFKRLANTVKEMAVQKCLWSALKECRESYLGVELFPCMKCPNQKCICRYV